MNTFLLSVYFPLHPVAPFLFLNTGLGERAKVNTSESLALWQLKSCFVNWCPGVCMCKYVFVWVYCNKMACCNSLWTPGDNTEILNWYFPAVSVTFAHISVAMRRTEVKAEVTRDTQNQAWLCCTNLKLKSKMWENNLGKSESLLLQNVRYVLVSDFFFFFWRGGLHLM